MVVEEDKFNEINQINNNNNDQQIDIEQTNIKSEKSDIDNQHIIKENYSDINIK